MSNEKAFTIWTTRATCLYFGIAEEAATECFEDGVPTGWVRLRGGMFLSAKSENADWHRTRDGAIRRAEQMRREEIASLKKRIEDLEKMNFGGPNL
jgi:hypothetical protein